MDQYFLSCSAAAMSSFLGLAVLVFLSGGTWAALPHGWEACKLGSDGYEDCMIKQINTAIQTLKGGSKVLKVSPLDPLRVTSLTLEQGSGPVSIKLEFMDSDIKGLSSCELKAFKNTDWKKFEGSGHCKAVSLLGKYKIDGKVLSLPIKGSGDAEIKFDDYTVDVVIDLKEIKKDGKRYYQVVSFLADVKPAKTSYRLDNLFNGNKQLGDTMNAFLNENAAQIYNELKPAMTKTLSQAFSQITNQIFTKIPAEELNVK